MFNTPMLKRVRKLINHHQNGPSAISQHHDVPRSSSLDITTATIPSIEYMTKNLTNSILGKLHKKVVYKSIKFSTQKNKTPYLDTAVSLEACSWI